MWIFWGIFYGEIFSWGIFLKDKFWYWGHFFWGNFLPGIFFFGKFIRGSFFLGKLWFWGNFFQGHFKFGEIFSGKFFLGEIMILGKFFLRTFFWGIFGWGNFFWGCSCGELLTWIQLKDPKAKKLLHKIIGFLGKFVEQSSFWISQNPWSKFLANLLQPRLQSSPRAANLPKNPFHVSSL